MHSTTTDIRSYGATHILIRALTPADRKRVAEEFSPMGEQTRRPRFGGLARRLSDRDLDRLTGIDHHNHEALAAAEPGTDRAVGIARYIAVPGDPGAAEVAVEMEEEWHGYGIGRRLISEFVGRARIGGITRYLAYIRRDNLTVLAWIDRVSGTAAAQDGDATLYAIPLGRAKADRRAA